MTNDDRFRRQVTEQVMMAYQLAIQNTIELNPGPLVPGLTHALMITYALTAGPEMEAAINKARSPSN